MRLKKNWLPAAAGMGLVVGVPSAAMAGGMGLRGPDSYGYIGQFSPYNLRDISGTGTAGPTGDNQSLLAPIGFEFEFYGEIYDQVYICSNGYLSFTSSSADFSSSQLPANGEPNMIAGAWTDLDPIQGGAIYYQTTGTAPMRQFVVGYYGVQHHLDCCDSGPTPSTFEIILHERSNTIEIQYQSLVQNEDFSLTSSMAIGLRNADGSDGLSAGWFLPPGLSDIEWLNSTAYMFTPPVGSAGPDAFGYTGNVTSHHLRNISGGKGGGMGPTGDDSSLNAAIGFDFEYYGSTYNSVNICSNGFLSFTSASTPALSGPMPESGVNEMIAGAWTDLDVSAGGSIVYETLGGAPNREFVVGYYGVPHFSDSLDGVPTTYTFEIILHENSNTIEFQYDDVPLNEDSATAATPMSIGIRHGNGDDGLQMAWYPVLYEVDVSRLENVGYALTPPIGSTGPDVFGYRGRDSDYDLRDISGTGTPGPTADDQSVQVPIGFDFPYYGQTYDQVYICSNGFLSFTSSLTWSIAERIPDVSYDDMIAGAWTDLNPNQGGAIYYETLGTSPNREFVVGYYGVQHYYDDGSSPTPSTFEIILHETSGDVEFQYAEVRHEDKEEGSSFRQPISIGIQNSTGSDGIQVDWFASYSSTHYPVHNDRGYVIRDCPWDVNGDNVVGVLDLLEVLGKWGPAPSGSFADIDADGDVGIIDLLSLLGNWGGCP